MPRTRPCRWRPRHRPTPQRRETTAADTGATDTAATDVASRRARRPAGGGEVTFPLSFTQAEEQGIDVEWGDRCDPETGRLAVPDFFAPECYAPFEGDNGGATAPGVTADSIKVVYYLGPEDDPIINYITDAIANDDTNADSEATLTTMRDYYETYYELYGRKVELQFVRGHRHRHRRGRGPRRRRAHRRGDPAVRRARRAGADHRVRRRVSPRGHAVHRLQPGQPDDLYTDRDPYNLGIAAAARQKNEHVVEFISKQLTGKNAEYAGDELRRRRASSAWSTSSRARNRRRSPTSSSPNSSDAGIDVRRASPVRPRPGDDPGDRGADHREAEGGRRHDGHLQRRPGRARDFTREATRRSTSPSGSSPLAAGRHHRVRPHVRPGAVEARVRRHPAERRGPCPR